MVRMNRSFRPWLLALVLVAPGPVIAQGAAAPAPAGAPAVSAWPAVTEGDAVLKGFTFRDGQQLDLRIHYRTLGTPTRGKDGRVNNAVLITHGTGGSGAQFLRPEFAGALFNPGQLLDATRYFIVLPDGIGHGGSSKPSNGLRAKFPRYGYEDMVRAQHDLLVQALGVDHLRLVMGTSMGGMHTWLWAQRYPQMMDAAMPLASVPNQISGRNRAWRRVVIDAIRHDPAWQGGDYTVQPPSLATAQQMLFLMSSNPQQRQAAMPSLADADRVLDAFVANGLKTADANDSLYQLEASFDYDPAPGLARIEAPLLAWNTADDLINPPELGLLEAGIRQVKRGRAVVVPLSPATRGHGSHTIAALWMDELRALLERSTPEGAFLDSLLALCGQAFAGKVLANEPAAPRDPFIGKSLVMHVRECGDSEVRVPFHVGDDRSRTWVLTRTAAGLRLKHDHRHADGSPDAVTLYGGDSVPPGTAVLKEFPADADSVAMFLRAGLPASTGNTWSMTLEPGLRLVYALKRADGRHFAVGFDLSRPVAAPPAPWGASVAP